MSADKKLRIGILTIHGAVNYGSMLQAYALQREMEAVAGDDAVVLIDYLPPCIMDAYSLNPLKNMGNPKQFLKYCVNFRDRRKRNRVFREFAQDYFHLSPRKYTNGKQLKRDCANWNVIVVGSDQVWNPEIVKKDRTFWLEFAEKCYKASFSSSFGTTQIPESYRNALMQALKRFDSIAVREPSAAAMLSDMARPVTITCDPVFLLSAGQWGAVERKPEGVPDRYFLMYTVERNKKLEALVREAAEYFGLSVVDLGIRNNPRAYFGVHSPEFGPREFLYLIHHADFMVTNSFHGTAFAGIFQKKCISIHHHSRGTRIRELAELTGRSGWILSEDAAVSDAIRLFTEAREDDASPLEERIAASRAYLENMLADARSAQCGGTDEERG